MAQLAHERVVADDASPERWLFVLHGIFGAGRNWASVMRRLVRARPDWGALLIDLRQHGASHGFTPPHTVATAAGDVLVLGETVAMSAILGHSFGGKVALAAAGASQSSPRQVWVVDSTPERREPSGSAWSMLEVVRSLPDRFATRAQLIEALQSQGVAAPVAQWMATNLEAGEGGYRWRFDVDAIHDLLMDFFETDLWHVVESPPPGLAVHMVKAEESGVLTGEALERMERAARDERVFLHRVAGGHWVNAENPEALIDLLVQHLPEA